MIPRVLPQLPQHEGQACTLLKVACHWLRAEVNEAKLEKEREKASGQSAMVDANPNLVAYVAGGGYAPGRMAHQGI
ncbi:unnamed protein product [Choristocarpus tenellus]